MHDTPPISSLDKTFSFVSISKYESIPNSEERPPKLQTVFSSAICCSFSLMRFETASLFLPCSSKRINFKLAFIVNLTLFHIQDHRAAARRGGAQYPSHRPTTKCYCVCSWLFSHHHTRITLSCQHSSISTTSLTTKQHCMKYPNTLLNYCCITGHNSISFKFHTR